LTQASPKAEKKNGIASFFSFLAVGMFFVNIKTALTVSASLFKFGWLLPMVLSMILSLVLYAVVYGWNLAFIIVPLILVHELGHWIWMKAYGLDPKAPMFVPFLGAFVAMTKMPASEATHAWVAFAGPFVGGVSSLVLYLFAEYTGQTMLRGAAYIGFFLNLMQLIPAKPLDGGFIVGAVSKWLLVPGVAALFVLGALWRSPFMFVIGFFAVISFFKKDDPIKGTARTVKELEVEFVAGCAPGGVVAQSKSSATATGKASKAQRFQIGAAYLALVAGLGLMITWVTLETGHTNKAFASTQIKIFTAAIAVKDDASLRYMRSQVYAGDDKIAEALADTQKAIELGRKDYDVYLNKARFMLALGESDSAVTSTLVKACELAPAQSDEAWTAAYGLLLCGDYDDALKMRDHLTERGRLDIGADAMEHKGEIDKARELYDKAILVIPDYVWGTRWRRALFNISENHMDLAKTDIDKALSIGPDEPNVNLTMGWYQFKKGDLAASWKSTDVVLEKAKDDDFIDKPCVLAGCHKLRYEISKLRAQEPMSALQQTKWRERSVQELAAYDKHPAYATLFVPRAK